MCHMRSIRHKLAVCIKDVVTTRTTSPRHRILKRLQILKYAVMTDHAKKAMLF